MAIAILKNFGGDVCHEDRHVNVDKLKKQE